MHLHQSADRFVRPRFLPPEPELALDNGQWQLRDLWTVTINLALSLGIDYIYLYRLANVIF